MANPIRKLIQLVLDKRAADKAEADTKKSLTGMEKGLARLKKAALSVGATLAAAFAIRSVVRFGREVVRVAQEAEAIWNRLGHAVESVGGNFAEVLPEVRQLARAMQDVTTVGDEDFASILTELITTSGDYARSLRNVGVVADLAAAKQIDLRSAAQLVGRAMVGQTATLTRYGIVVKEGEDAVEAIRKQFAGFAMSEAKTFQGRVKQLTNEWMDFKQALGEVFTTSQGGISVMERLIETVKRMTEWVEVNKDTIIRYVDGVMAALEKLLGFIGRTVEFFDPVAKLTREQGELIRNTKNLEALERQRLDHAREILELQEKQAEEQANIARLEKTAWLTTTPLMWAKDRLARIEREIKARQGLILSIDETVDARNREATVLPPMAPPAGEGEGVTTDVSDQVEGAKELLDIWRQYPGVMVYLTQAESDAATQAERLETAMAALNQQMQVSPKNAALIAEAMDEWASAAQRVERQMAVAGEVAQAVGDVMFGALGSGVGEMAKYKAKQNAIMAAEQLAMGIVASLNPLTAPIAGKHYAAAAKFSAIAAAWGTLAGAAGSFGGRGGGGAGATRDVGGAAAARAEAPGPEVHIYFDGPGFDAVNPTVQRVLAGAAQIYGERYGPNAKVQTHRRR